MRKTVYFLLIVSGLFLQSCLKDEEDVFDKSAAERMDDALTEYKTVLTAAPNGWLMEYYPEQDQAIGGYTYLCSFNASGEVTVASEITTRNYQSGDQVTSLYKLITDQGPVLSFDTYNEVFHYFSEPSGSDVDGYAGDYEFIILKADQDSVVMKGKKYANRIVMTPLAEGTDWSEYLQQIVTISEESVFGTYKFFIGNQETADVTQTERTFSFKYSEGGEVRSAGVSFIYTTTGIKFYKPLTLGGVTMENFDWHGSESTYVCTDEGVTARLVVDLPENYLYYNDYIGNWVMHYFGTLTKNITISQEVKNKILRVRGFEFDFLMNYDMATGSVAILAQNVGTYNGYIVGLSPWDPSSGYLTWGAGIGLISEWNGDLENFVISFKDNGVWGTYVADGFLFWMFNSSGASVGRYTGGEYRFPFLSMIKQ
ncbi:MAG: DUF4302 domain-containing protein [Mangrovibacterium sp.]